MWDAAIPSPAEPLERRCWWQQSRRTSRASLADPTVVPPSADRDGFRAELESVRMLGYARSRGETIVGAASVAAPVDWGYRGVAAISVTGPEARFGPSQQMAAVHALLEELDRLHTS